MDTNFSVRRAGAKGDGKNDDTVFFQKLLDLAAESQGTVIVEPGLYRVGRLKLHPHVGLVGFPTYAWKGSAGSVLQLADPGAVCLLDLTFALGARIDGLCLDGQNLGSGIHGILVDKPDYGITEDSPIIERSKVSHFTGDGVRLNRIWCFRIRGNMFSQNGGHGLSVRGWDGFVLDNWFSSNGGAGFSTIGENNAVTITGNRIEWNKMGGVRVLNGSHYNITGNYIDRCGPGILFVSTSDNLIDSTRIVGRVGYSTIIGNVIYRSGRPDWNREGEWSSAHLVLIGARGVTVSANTMVAGRDDENNAGSFGYSERPNWSPDFGVVVGALSNSIIKDNVMDSCALKELILDRSEHGSGLVIKDNIGNLFIPQESSAQEPRPYRALA